MSKTPKFEPTLPEKYPTIKDVVGSAREFIEELQTNIDGKKVFSSLGINPDKIYLLTGGPGLGKTMAVKALNNTKNYHLLRKTDEFNKQKNQYLLTGTEPTEEVNITLGDLELLTFEYDIGRYGTAYINMGSRIVQSFFDSVFFYGKLGKDSLVVLDEADALLTSRNSRVQTHAEDRKVLETIMKNLQTAHDMENIYVVLMSNLPREIDNASIRAGRIDRRIRFELPDKLERKTAYEDAIKQTNKRAGYKVIRSYDINSFVKLSEDFNYADIYQSVEQALRNKARELIKTKEPGIVRAGYVRQNRLEDAIRNHKKEFKGKEKNIGFI